MRKLSHLSTFCMHTGAGCFGNATVYINGRDTQSGGEGFVSATQVLLSSNGGAGGTGGDGGTSSYVLASGAPTGGGGGGWKSDARCFFGLVSCGSGAPSNFTGGPPSVANYVRKRV